MGIDGHPCNPANSTGSGRTADRRESLHACGHGEAEQVSSKESLHACGHEKATQVSKRERPEPQSQDLTTKKFFFNYP